MPQFYKRELPDQCVAFTSAEGRRLFREALDSGTMECYFPLAEQFRTQGLWQLVFDAWCAPHLPGCTRRACILRAFNARVHAQRTESGPRPSMEGCVAVVRRKHGATRRYTRLAACMRAPLTARSVCLVCAAHRVCAIASLTAVSPWKSSKHKVGAILCSVPTASLTRRFGCATGITFDRFLCLARCNGARYGDHKRVWRAATL